MATTHIFYYINGINYKQKMNQNSSHIQDCLNCAAVQSIVRCNEQMIQEQIKLIKTLHEDKLALIDQYAQLERKYAQLQQQKLFGKSIYERVDQQQQTEALNDEKEDPEIEQRSLRVTSKLNQNQQSLPVTKVSMGINKQNLSQFIPLVMIRKDEQYFSRKRRNSFEEESQAPHWLKAIEHSAPHHCHSKFKQKTTTLIKKMVPHELRHLIWSMAMENSMAITDELYFELLERKNMGWVSEEVRNQIERDICRSFSGRTHYEERAGLRAQVSEVLELFHLYRPDISYVQGMTYPVIVLTLVVGKVKAFSLFSNLILSNPFFKRLFTFEPQFVKTVARTFDILLLEYCPDIAEKMIIQRIDSQIFLVEWLFTVFSRSLSFQATLKFWDQLAYFGQVTLFRLALSIFQLIGPRLMETNYEDTLGLIQCFGGFITQTKLSELLKHHKLTSDKLTKTIQRVERFMLQRAQRE